MEPALPPSPAVLRRGMWCAFCALIALGFCLTLNRPAAAWPCKVGVVQVQAVGPSTYGIVLGAAGTGYTGDVLLNLYTNTARYPLAIPAASIMAKNGVPDQIGMIFGHRSVPYYFTIPGQEQLEAVAVSQGTDPAGNPCDLRPYQLSVTHPATVPFIDTRAIGGLGTEIKAKYVATATPLAAGAPETLPAPTCATPYKLPLTTRPVAPQPDWGAAAGNPTELNVNGEVWVLVEIDDADKNLGVGLYRSSGSPLLDAATRYAASSSDYAAAVFRCAPIAGPILFHAQFTGPP
jgi:hypothetical protein